MKRLAAIFLIALALPAGAQQRYFTAEQQPDLIKCLPAPPDSLSPAFSCDVMRYMWGKTQRHDADRAEMTKRDAVWSYEALLGVFDDAFGLHISKEATPRIWTVLENSLSTTDPTRVAPKAYYHRRRPFEVFNEPTFTGEDEELSGEGSYPSGHTMRGWMAAQLLSQINPAAANELFARAWAYGDSRVIAGAHWQSDVDISRVAASVMYSRLQTSARFQDEMAAAQEEFRRLAYGAAGRNPSATAQTGNLKTGDATTLAQGGREYFVSLCDAIPDAIFEIRYFTTYNFIGDRIDGYLAPVALMTRQAADSLRVVSDELVKLGYRIKVYDAYRPQMAVDHFARWALDLTDTRMKASFYPDLNKNVLFKLGFIAHKSGHTRGSTVDLTLVDILTGRELDMGYVFDGFGSESHPDFCGDPYTGKYDPSRCGPGQKPLTEQQFRNRMILRTAMLRHGFKPLSSEWWHFTLRNEPFPDTYFNFPVY